MKTHFAPPDRLSAEATFASHVKIQRLPFVRDVMNAVPYASAVMNTHRQVVYANDALCRLLDFSDPQEYIGKRSGEIFNCIHACQGPNGCGTAKACRRCGGTLAVLESLQANKSVCRELKLTVTRAGYLGACEYQISVSPFAVGNENYSIVSFVDTSHEKRKMMLERIFFHDILNTAGNIAGLSASMAGKLPDVSKEDVHLIGLRAKQLVEEIRSQRILAKAENQQLVVRPEALNTLDCLEHMAELYKEFSPAGQITVCIDNHAEQISLESDKTLLSRVLSDMVKNALEACSGGDTVTIGCYRLNHQILFWVHNPAYIPREIQWQIFKRSFSTKGEDRGLGTYSIKLLVENYLNGRVAFDSSPTEGTHFYVTLPQPPAATSPSKGLNAPAAGQEVPYP